MLVRQQSFPYLEVSVLQQLTWGHPYWSWGVIGNAKKELPSRKPECPSEAENTLALSHEGRSGPG